MCIRDQLTDYHPLTRALVTTSSRDQATYGLLTCNRTKFPTREQLRYQPTIGLAQFTVRTTLGILYPVPGLVLLHRHLLQLECTMLPETIIRILQRQTAVSYTHLTLPTNRE